MAAKAITVELLKQIFRLKENGFSVSAIARLVGVSRPTVIKYLSRLRHCSGEEGSFKQQDLSFLYEQDTSPGRSLRYSQLMEHFQYAETELKKTGVTRQHLWMEYKEQHPVGYNYSQYCFHFAEYLKNKEVVMHLEHKAAERVMIDFAGKKLSYADPYSGEIIHCQVFISVLPFSGLIFCYAVHTQNTQDFTCCVNEMLKYYEGVPLTILTDNLKTVVTRPCRYEPVFTDVCHQLSEHYI